MKTNFKKALAIVLSVTMTVSALSAVTLPASAATGAFDENNITLRFPAISDTHITELSGTAASKLTKALDQLVAKAKEKDPNAKLDALLVAGDFTDYGLKSHIQSFATLVKRKIDPTQTRLVIAQGNHELYNTQLNQAPYTVGQDMVEAFGADGIYQGATEEEIAAGNYHTTVNGYHMIAVNCMTYSGGVKFREEDMTWLKNALDAAVADSSEKPIFLTFHPQVKGTNLGSNEGAYWATTDDELFNLLSNYPQVISFSGHLHYPENDERTIWQGGWTTVGLGSVYYASMQDQTENGISYVGMHGTQPADNMDISQGAYVEVDANNNVRITRMDFAKKAEIKDPWVIPAPKADKSHLQVYSPQAQQEGNTAPVFGSDATITAKENSDETVPLYNIRFNAATDNDLVKHYEISFYEEAHSETPIKTLAIYSDYYSKPDPATMSKRISLEVDDNALYPFYRYYSNDYHVEVRAVDCYGMKSEPLKSDVIKGTGKEPEKVDIGLDPHPDWEYKQYCSFNKFTEGYQMVVGADFNGWPTPDMANAAKHLPMTNNGYNNSLAVSYESYKNEAFLDVLFSQSLKGYRKDFMGAKEFWIWVDFSDIQLETVYFGWRQGSVYPSDDKKFETINLTGKEDMHFYYQNSEGAWEEGNFTTDGYMDGEKLSGYKGFIRFDASYFHNGQYSMSPTQLEAFEFRYKPVSSDEAGGKTIVIDQIGFSGPTIKESDTLVQDLLDGKTIAEDKVLDPVTYEEENKVAFLDFDEDIFVPGDSVFNESALSKDYISSTDKEWYDAKFFDYTFVEKEGKYPLASETNKMLKIESFENSENSGKYVGFKTKPIIRSILGESQGIDSKSMDSGIMFYIDMSEFEFPVLDFHFFYSEQDYDENGNEALNDEGEAAYTTRAIAENGVYYIENEDGQFIAGGRGDKDSYISIAQGYKGYVKIPFGSCDLKWGSNDVNGKVDLRDFDGFTFNYGSYGNRLGPVYLDDFQFYGPAFDFNKVTLGDINGDEAINVEDALLALQHSVGLKKLEGVQFVAADVNEDQVVDIIDALQILQYSVGLRTEFTKNAV